MFSMGARVCLSCSWGIRAAVPSSMAATVFTSSSPPSTASRAFNSSAVSLGPMGVDAWEMMSPASSSVAMCMMVTPVSSSPFRMAQLMGAAPR